MALPEAGQFQAFFKISFEVPPTPHPKAVVFKPFLLSLETPWFQQKLRLMSEMENNRDEMGNSGEVGDVIDSLCPVPAQYLRKHLNTHYSVIRK